MGFSGRKHILPAPTESIVDSVVEESAVTEDIATDLSRRTDRTSATIPDDGSPVTITTDSKQRGGKVHKSNNQSQASLLIEFYEGAEGSGTGRRPSLRVRVGPSKNQGKVVGDGHLVISQPGSRAASSTYRIPLTSKTLRQHTAEDVSILDGSQTGDRRQPAGVDIEIGDGGSDLSKLSRSPEPLRYVLDSDVSSMPPESFLGPINTVPPIVKVAPQSASSIMSRSDMQPSVVSDMPRSTVSNMPDSNSDLKPPVYPREQNSSRERLTQKAIAKISSRERSSGKPRSHRSGSGSGTREIVATGVGERHRKGSRSYGEESSLSTGTDPSQLSNSVVSAGVRSMGQPSVLSESSELTNPRLLKTVEDAIRRLILPELKEIKRTNSKRHSDRYSYNSESENSIAREKAAAHRISSGSGSRRRVSKSSGSKSKHPSRGYTDADYDSVSDASLSEQYDGSQQKGHRTRDLATAALAGTAAAAALRHQNSSSTIDQEEEDARRERRARSRSHSSKGTSTNESERIFLEHDVPPMPFRSELGSDLTRSSLLSSNTANTVAPSQREVRSVVRAANQAGLSPEPQTPTRQSGDNRNSLGLHHRNFSEHDLSARRQSPGDEERSQGSPEAEYTPETVREQPYTSQQLYDPERMKQYERNLHQQHPIRRGLSPIQSVASYATTEPTRNSVAQVQSMDSIASMKRRQQALREEVSMDSFSSASPDMKKQSVPRSVALDDVHDVAYQRGMPLGQSTSPLVDRFSGDRRSDSFRDSLASSEDPKLDYRRMTNYTDESRDSAHLDEVGTAQQVTMGYAGTAEYIHTPPGVESAVASLVSQSGPDTSNSTRQSLVESSHSRASQHSVSHDAGVVKSTSPLKQQLSANSFAEYEESEQYHRQRSLSPARSFVENREDVLSTPAGPKEAASPESEITTNPSIIHGPKAGVVTSSHDHWSYSETPERETPNFPAQQALERDLRMHAPELMPPALNVSQRNTHNPNAELYTPGAMTPTPPGNKVDEGYATGDTMRSGKQNERGFSPDEIEMADASPAKRNQYVSGLSQGMSPLYDASTGTGRDRIQSKDIIALMDHLAVRDGQRNARDTELLITLVQTATEMRNSMENIKKFIAEQGDFIVGASEQQHEKTQRAIGGPRPAPQPVSKTPQRSLPPQDDTPAKRRANIFKRALQSLGSKNESELENIERMLEQVLDQTHEIRMNQVGQIPAAVTQQPYEARSRSLTSAENVRAPTDTGYEPEGQAGTSSSGDRSGFFSRDSSRQADYRSSGRKEQINRVSTVDEGNEDEEDNLMDYGIEHDDAETPRASPAAEQQYRQSRDIAARVETPPKLTGRLSQPWADEHTPQYTYETPTSGRKNKSNTLSIFGKGVMSRWSRTTASSMPDTRHNSTQRGQPYAGADEDEDDLDDRHGQQREGYGHDEYLGQENRPPSPLVPSQVSEPAKYQGFRNSQNLQHPQPRQGPTGRHQYTLENEAQTYDDQFSPTSHTSSQHWDQQMSSSRDHNTMSQYAPQPPLSPISDGGYSEVSSRSAASRRRAQARPRVVDDEPLFPQGIKGTMSPSTYVDQVKAARAGSPAYDKSPIGALRSQEGPQRKPSGPRPLSSSGSKPTTTGRYVAGDMNTIKKTRFRGSPNQIDSVEDLTR